jgi:hypothetical protein
MVSCETHISVPRIGLRLCFTLLPVIAFVPGQDKLHAGGRYCKDSSLMAKGDDLAATAHSSQACIVHTRLTSIPQLKQPLGWGTLPVHLIPHGTPSR